MTLCGAAASAQDEEDWMEDFAAAIATELFQWKTHWLLLLMVSPGLTAGLSASLIHQALGVMASGVCC
jgi:hypothetical protein